MTRTADVAIIGGGVIGTSIAYRLAKAGKKVVLCEKDDFASGATGSCDQMVILQSKKPGFHLKIALDSAEMFQTLGKELGADIEYFQKGGMITIENDLEMEVMKKTVAEQKATGLQVDIIDRKEAAKRQRGLGEHLLGCAYSPADGEVNPFKLNLAFARGAKALGAELLIDCPVTGFVTEGGKVKGIKTAKGEVHAETVILAAGAWSPIVGKELGINVPIKPRRGQIIITEPVAPYVNGDLLSAAQYIVAKHHPETLLNSKSRAIQLGVGLSLTQTAKGDGLKEINIIRIMSGFRPYTPDGLPMIGYVDKMPGLFMACGHEGDGIALSAITGKIAQEVICEGKAYIDISPLNPNRFEMFA